MKLIRIVQGEGKLQILFQTTSELIDLALLIWNVLQSISSELMELDDVLVHRGTTLLQASELLTHLFHKARRDIVRREIFAEIIPADHSASPRVLQLLPPNCCLPLELKRCKLDEVLWMDIVALKVFDHVPKPILNVKRLVTRREGLRLVREELIQRCKLITTMVEIALLLIVPLLQQLN